MINKRGVSDMDGATTKKCLLDELNSTMKIKIIELKNEMKEISGLELNDTELNKMEIMDFEIKDVVQLIDNGGKSRWKKAVIPIIEIDVNYDGELIKFNTSNIEHLESGMTKFQRFLLDGNLKNDNGNLVIEENQQEKYRKLKARDYLEIELQMVFNNMDLYNTMMEIYHTKKNHYKTKIAALYFAEFANRVNLNDSMEIELNIHNKKIIMSDNRKEYVYVSTGVED